MAIEHGPGGVRETQCTGPLYAHLGHFATPEVLRAGHNRVLDAPARASLKETQFALSGRRYPIPDAAHARAALARVAQHGTAEEQATVRRTVAKKFPGMSQG